MDVVEPDAGGGEAAVGAGDDVVPSHDSREPDDALGDQLGMLHQVGGVADDTWDQDHPGRRLKLLEDVILVLVAGLAASNENAPALIRKSTSTMSRSAMSCTRGPTSML
jgi:hypothetical protein